MLQPSSGRAWLLPLSKEMHVLRQALEPHVFPRVQNVTVERESKTQQCWKTLPWLCTQAFVVVVFPS